MKVLVTGSAGFIGSHLCALLHEDGQKVIGLDIKNGNDVVTCNLPAYDDVDKVFHLAAQTDARSSDVMNDARDNILSAIRIMQRYGKKVVFSSSSAVNYPNSPYGISKLACEHYAKLFGCGVVRFCNIYGDGGRSFRDLYKNKPVVYANLPGTQVRTYAPVEDACISLLTCKPGKLNILVGEDLTVNEIIHKHYSKKEVHWFPAKKFDVIEGRQIYPFELVKNPI